MTSASAIRWLILLMLLFLCSNLPQLSGWISLLICDYTYDFSATGGATYCALASLRLMGFIEDDLLSKGTSVINIPMLLEWIVEVCFSITSILTFVHTVACQTTFSGSLAILYLD